MTAILKVWVEHDPPFGIHTHVYLPDGTEIPNVLAIVAERQVGEHWRIRLELLDAEIVTLDAAPPDGKVIGGS